MNNPITEITCTLAEFYQAIGKEASSIRLEEMHVIHQILKKMLGRALMSTILTFDGETKLNVTLDNQKLPVPIHSVVSLAENFHMWRQMLIDTATDEASSYRDRQKMKPSLVNLSWLDDKEAREACEQLTQHPDRTDGYLFEGVTQIECRFDIQNTPSLNQISFRWKGQTIRCSVSETLWEDVGGEIEALLGASLHGNVSKFTIHESGYRTALGQYQEMESVTLEQG